MEQQDGATGVATVAKEQAGQVGQTAANAGGQVAQTTKEQAQNVVGEAKAQARDLVGEARTQARHQAGTQKSRAVQGIRSIGDELQEMAAQSGQSGLATEVARQAADRAHGLAQYLDQHEPADLLEQVRAYARRRPVMFLASAAVAGVLAGRLTRNLADQGDSGPAALPSGRTQELTSGYEPSLATGYQTAPTEVYDPGYQATPPVSVDPTPGYSGSPVAADPTYPATPAGTGYEDTGYDPAAPGTGYPTGGGAYEEDQPPSRGWTP